jgi:hypothetical protein
MAETIAEPEGGQLRAELARLGLRLIGASADVPNAVRLARALNPRIVIIEAGALSADVAPTLDQLRQDLVARTSIRRSRQVPRVADPGGRLAGVGRAREIVPGSPSAPGRQARTARRSSSRAGCLLR